MKFNVFNNTKIISLADDIVKLYEDNVAPMDFHRAEYLIISSGVKEDDCIETLNYALKSGALEEIEAHEEVGKILARMQFEESKRKEHLL
jgi:hypothetical protein